MFRLDNDTGNRSSIYSIILLNTDWLIFNLRHSTTDDYLLNLDANERFNVSLQCFHIGIKYRRYIERYELGKKQSANNRNPSGRRASAPAPNPSAMGRLPIMAAMVVIMMGRNRIRQP